MLLPYSLISTMRCSILLIVALVALSTVSAVRVDVYSGNAACTGSPTQSGTVPENSCQSGANSGVGSGSVKFVCASGTLTEYTYAAADTACATVQGNLSIPSGTCVPLLGASMKLTCGAAAIQGAIVALLVACVAALKFNY